MSLEKKTISVATLRRPPEAETHALDDIIIGKDILELVSSAMYIDPMTVYREYIQNAADAVDLARSKKLLSAEEPGLVDISVDASARSVRIRDNGSGLGFAEFGRRLTALGGSSKRGTSARGFRGVGRLAGLGYAQELVFRSRVEGEDKVSQLRWDCRLLKSSLRSADNDAGIADLVRAAVVLERITLEDAPERFFEVELRGIIRLRNDILMNPDAISDYLRQVAPLPFDPAFAWGATINEALQDFVDMNVLEVRVNGSDAPLYRPHKNSILVSDKQYVSFDDIEIIRVPGIDGETSALAWILHHGYEGALPIGTLVKGLRLRSGNVQVGDSALLEDLFPEPRFNGWSVGEVHVIDRRIVPNGRRDHFEQNAHYHNLTNHLSPAARDIARRCRTSSVQRKWLRELDLRAEAITETVGIIKQGGLNLSERERMGLSAQQSLMQIEKIAAMEIVKTAGVEHQRLIGELKCAISVALNDDLPNASPLNRLVPAEREMYERFFGLIYECSVNRVAAKSLIDRILMKLERSE